MNTLSLIGGALTLRTETYRALRERSDVFYRGFVLILVVGLFAGVFQAGLPLLARGLRPQSEQQIADQAVQAFRSYSTPGSPFGSTVEESVRQGVAMVFAIDRLPPNAGPSYKPISTALDYVGDVISVPFSLAFLGYLLVGGVFVQLTSAWLGGRASLAQMLGLGALGWAPHVLNPLSSLIEFAGQVSGSPVLGPLDQLVGWLVFIWGTVIFVKATAMAQGFSYGKALGALLLALLIGLIIAALLACMIGAVIAFGIGSLAMPVH